MRIAPTPDRQPRADRRGQSLVEFALVLPLLLLLFAASADFGRLFYGYVALENAVKEGAVFGSRYPLCNDSSTLCPNPDNVAWRVQNEARMVKNTDGTSISPTSSCVDDASGTVWTTDEELKNCEPGDSYVVTASFTFDLITPILGDIMGGSFTMSSQSTASVFNVAFDPTPGLAPTKLVRAADARNADDIRDNCEEPEPVDSPDYYRSPCVDVVDPIGPDIQASFREGDVIHYKLIVRNNGGTTVTSVTMTDSLGWSCPGWDATMPVNGPAFVCEYTRTAPTIGGSDVTIDYQNDLTVDGLEILPTIDSAIVTVEKPPPDLLVLKFVSAYRLGSDGDGSISGGASFGTADNLAISRNAAIPEPYAWYKLIVVNTGGQTATDVTITDSNGPLPFGQSTTTAVCGAAPTTIAAGGRWECRYRVSFPAVTTRVNSVTATASNVTPDGNDASSATVTVTDCAGPNRVVPSLIGLTSAEAQTLWTAAGFTGAVTSWSGSGTAVTQNRQAFSCQAPTTTVTITKTVTP